MIMTCIIKKRIHKFTCAILCIVLINAIPRSHAFALRPVAYKLSTVKSSSSGDLAGIPKNLLANSPSVFRAKKPKWAIRIAKALYGNRRLDLGETYLEHANKVANVLIDLNPEIDELTIAAALLHTIDIRTIEKDIEDLENKLKEFAKKPAAKYTEKDMRRIIDLVKNVNEVSRLPYQPPIKEGGRTIQNQMNMIVQITDNPEAMLLVFADKLESFMAYPELKKTQQDYIYREITHIYAPLAERLGADDWAAHFRDMALKVSKPELYDEVVDAIEKRLGLSYQDALVHLKEVAEKIKKGKNGLEQLGISADIKIRLKGVYSVYEKMQSIKGKKYGKVDGMLIEEIDEYINKIDDLLGITMVFDNEDDLWIASHIPFLDRDSMNARGDIKGDEGSKEFNVVAFHANVKDKESGRLYEFQLVTKDNYYNLKYGSKAHWAYKLNRETGQKFDVDSIKKTGDFYKDFYELKKSLDEWVFVFNRIDDIGGTTTLKPLRFLKGSISADFAAGSIDMFNKSYHKAVCIILCYDLMRDKIITLQKKELNQTAKLDSGTAIIILEKDNFLKRGSNAEQIIKRHAKMPRTHFLLDTLALNSVQMRKLAEKGKKILEKENLISIDNLNVKQKGRKRGYKNEKDVKDDFLYEVAEALGFKNRTELYTFLTGTNKDIIQQVKKRIKDYSLAEKRNALKKGRQLLEAGDNGLKLDNRRVLERLGLMLNDPSIRSASFNKSVKITTLQAFFIAIGDGKIDAELVKVKSSAAGKRFRIQKPNICASAA